MGDDLESWPREGRAIVEWTLRAGLSPVRGWLSPDELARGGRFVPPLGEQWLAARSWVRGRLARRLACRPADVPLLTDDRGRLWLAGDDGRGDVNVSHTPHVLALVMAGHRVGIDIEDPPPPGQDLVGLAEVVGTDREVDQLRTLPAGERTAAFQRWWVRKEAVLKADGAGFLTDPRLVHVGVTRVAAPTPWTVLDHGPLRRPEGATTPHTLLATAHDSRVGAVSVHVREVPVPGDLR